MYIVPHTYKLCMPCSITAYLSTALLSTSNHHPHNSKLATNQSLHKVRESRCHFNAPNMYMVSKVANFIKYFIKFSKFYPMYLANNYSVTI